MIATCYRRNIKLLIQLDVKYQFSFLCSQINMYVYLLLENKGTLCNKEPVYKMKLIVQNNVKENI